MKKGREKKETESSSMTKKSFRREINLLSQKRPKTKIKEILALVLKEECEKPSKKEKAKDKARNKRKQCACGC